MDGIVLTITPWVGYQNFRKNKLLKLIDRTLEADQFDTRFSRSAEIKYAVEISRVISTGI